MKPPKTDYGEVTLQAPPELESSDGISSLLTSLVPLLGSGSAIVMTLLSNSGITGLLTGGMFLVSSLGFVAVNGIRQRSQRMANLNSSRREYLAYLTKTRKTVRAAGARQRNAALFTAPAPDTLLCLAAEPARRWERKPSDDDFLAVRLGTRDEDLSLKLKAPDMPPVDALDPVCASAAHRFMMAHQRISGIPYSARLTDYKRVEIMGARKRKHELLNAMLCQAALWHSPEHLRIAVLTTSASVGEWQWLAALPHALTADALGKERQLAAAPEDVMLFTSVKEAQATLSRELGSRARFSGSKGAGAPHFLIVNDGYERAMLEQNATFFPEYGTEGVTLIDAPEYWGDLDEAHVLRVLFDSTVATEGLNATRDTDVETIDLIEKGHKPVKLLPDMMPSCGALSVAERLALAWQARDEEAVQEGTGEERISSKLPDLLGIDDIRHIDFTKNWARREGKQRLRVPIGLYDDKSVAVIDIKAMEQHGMGPHGVLVGATGSGKSEVLRTLVLSLALTHSPEQLNFVLIDFKGGATFAGMEGMPHISSIITNLGREASLVDRMADALQGEITRRQELLRQAGNFAKVADYEDARLNGGRSDLKPLPALFIVVDEFSELLSEHPDIIESFVQIGRVGRSLEIYLLMASQRLEQGKLRGLDSHLSYRVGLKTFTGDESMAVLGTKDAFTLPNLPGIGYLKTPDGTMNRFRASYVSGALEGSRETTFSVAVDQMRATGFAPAHKIWLDPLTKPNPLNDFLPDLAAGDAHGLVSARWHDAGFKIPVGIIDKPLEQRRETLVLDMATTAGHVAICGAPLSGKSTFLRTIVSSIALTHDPREAQCYILDFGGGTFASLASLSHVAGLAMRRDEEKIRRTIAEIENILSARERFFVDHGIDSMDTYRKLRAAGKADDGYGDVFLIVDGWGTMRSEYEDMEPRVQQIVARGLAYGVHFVVSMNRWMELRGQIADLIATKLELRLADVGDSKIPGKKAAAVPSIPGRGMLPEGLHFMVAAPRIDGSDDATTLSEGTAAMVQQINAAWHGGATPKLRLLPSELEYGAFAASLAKSGAAARAGQLALGLDEETLTPLVHDFNVEPHMYIFGEAQSGKSSFIRLMIREIERSYPDGGAMILAADLRRANLGQIPQRYLASYITSEAMARDEFEGLANVLKTRLPGPDVTAEQLRERSWWKGPEVYVLVDDYDLVATKSGNALAPLVPFLAQAGDVGLHVIVARRTGGASRALFDPVLSAMQDLSMPGLLLSGDPNEGQLIGKVKAKQAKPGRVQVVTRDRGLFNAQLAHAAETR